jgi:cell division protein FtsL
MKKIKVTTIEKMANVQIIELNASFIARVVRLQAQLEPIVENITRTKRKFNDETKKYDDILDENGNKVIEYDRVDGKVLAENVIPFINELCEAFEE